MFLVQTYRDRLVTIPSASIVVLMQIVVDISLWVAGTILVFGLVGALARLFLEDGKVEPQSAPKRISGEEGALTALEQNWLHARHVEDERLWFTNIYAVVVAGASFVFRENGFGGNSYLLYFLVVFSILGLVVTVKTSYEFSNHLEAIKRTVKDFGLENYMGIPGAYKGKTTAKILRVRYAFALFYVIMTAIWIAILLLE